MRLLDRIKRLLRRGKPKPLVYSYAHEYGTGERVDWVDGWSEDLDEEEGSP